MHRIKDWNDAAIMKHIRNLLYRKDSIWVAWVQEVLLRQGSIWNAKIPSRCSWSWWKILQLRDRVRPFIRHRVCNGVEAFLWHDFWTPWVQSFLFLVKGFFMTSPYIGMLVLLLSWMVLGGIGLLPSQLIS